jgi:hypothetical protein
MQLVEPVLLLDLLAEQEQQQMVAEAEMVQVAHHKMVALAKLEQSYQSAGPQPCMELAAAAVVMMEMAD